MLNWSTSIRQTTHTQNMFRSEWSDAHRNQDIQRIRKKCNQIYRRSWFISCHLEHRYKKKLAIRDLKRFHQLINMAHDDIFALQWIWPHSSSFVWFYWPSSLITINNNRFSVANTFKRLHKTIIWNTCAVDILNWLRIERQSLVYRVFAWT